MADKEVTIKVSTETDISQVDSLESQLEDMQDSADSLGASLDESFNNIDSSSISEASTELTDLESEIHRLKDEIAFNEEWGFTSEAIELQEQLEEAEAKAEELRSSLDSSNGSGLEDTSESARELANNSEDAQKGIEGINQSLGVMEGAMLLDVAEKVGQLGSQAESMAQEMNTAAISVGQLATQTGVAESQMVGLINNISNATFPQEEAMMYVKSLDQIGVSSENLGKSATDLDRINDAFGLGADRTNSLGQELSVLGVDMNNVSSSFNALAYANSNTVGGMENYYNFLRRYDSQFNELGLNVDQASIIIAGATQKFGGGRAALTGLSDALKNANGDTRKLEEALGLQAGSLENASQITGQYEGQLQQLADEEAEHKTLLDQLGAAWEDATLSMSNVMSPAMSVIGLIGQFGQFTVGINGILTLAESFGILNTANLATIPGMIISTVTKYASAAASWALAAAEWAAASPLVLLAVLIGAVVLALIALYMNSEQVRVTIDNMAQSIWNAMVSIGEAVGNMYNVTIGWLSNMINGFMNWRNNIINTVTSTASNAVNGFVSRIGGMYNALVNELNNMLSAVGKWASTLPQKFWDAGVNAVKQFLSALGIASPGTMQRTLIWEIQEMGDRIPEESQGLLKNVSTLGSDVVDEFGQPNLAMDYSLNQDISNTNGGGNINDLRPVNLTLNVGTVDSEERLQEVYEGVIRLLRFENSTAGRSV